MSSSCFWMVQCLIFSVAESLRPVQPQWFPCSVHVSHGHVLTQRTMSSGKTGSTVSPYSHRCPAWAAVMSLWHFPKEVLKAHTEVLLITFFTYVFICCDIDLEWVLWEMVAAAQRLQGNERFYLSNLLGKVSCPSSISKSILRRTLKTEKEHVNDLGSILVFVSFGHIS